MAIPSRKTNNASSSTAARYGIRGSSAKKEKIPMARKKDIPPGEYRSKIVKVSITKTRAGDEAVSEACGEGIHLLPHACQTTLEKKEVIVPYAKALTVIKSLAYTRIDHNYYISESKLREFLSQDCAVELSTTKEECKL